MEKTVKFEPVTFGKRMKSMLQVDFRRMFKSKLFYILIASALVMPILMTVMMTMMTSTNPKMDWCNTLYFNYGHKVTFDYTLFRFNDYFTTHKANRSGSNGFLPDVYQI